MEKNSIGLIELSSVAAGFQVADVMLKTADVELLLNRTICSGKYMILVAGQVAAVEASVAAGTDEGASSIIDTCLIPNVDASLFPAISGTVLIQSKDALGIIESFSVAALIEGADAAVKTADVQLLEIRLAMALGGKGFVTFTGPVDAVRAAVDAGAYPVEQKGLLVRKVVIPAPRKELMSDLI